MPRYLFSILPGGVAMCARSVEYDEAAFWTSPLASMMNFNEKEKKRQEDVVHIFTSYVVIVLS